MNGDKSLFEIKRIEGEAKLVEVAMRYKECRILLGLLLEESSFLAPSFCGENTHTTAFKEGQRYIGKRIYELIMSNSDTKPTACMREAGVWLHGIKKSADAVEQYESEKGEEEYGR